MANLEYRHPTTDDIEDIVNLINTSNKDDPLWDVQTTEEFPKNTFENDDWKAEGYWIVLHDGDPVGYGGGVIFKRQLDHGRNEGWVAIWVLQDNREDGIQQELLRRSIGYLRGRGVERAKIWDLKGTEWRISMVKDAGFEEIWREYIMVHKIPDLKRPEPPDGLEFESFLLKESTDDQLNEYMTTVSNAFSEDEMFTPPTLESLKKWKESSLDIDRMTLARLEGKVVGECVSTVELQYNKLHNVNTGWIGAFGVLKEYRRRGIGKVILVNEMKWLQNQGMDTLYLGVSLENPKALGLYKSIGFEIEQEGIVYCLEL
jgi:GNAT superfamily N-acetyltransferase